MEVIIWMLALILIHTVLRIGYEVVEACKTKHKFDWSKKYD